MTVGGLCGDEDALVEVRLSITATQLPSRTYTE